MPFAVCKQFLVTSVNLSAAFLKCYVRGGHIYPRDQEFLPRFWVFRLKRERSKTSRSDRAFSGGPGRAAWGARRGGRGAELGCRLWVRTVGMDRFSSNLKKRSRFPPGNQLFPASGPLGPNGPIFLKGDSLEMLVAVRHSQASPSLYQELFKIFLTLLI